MAINNTYQHSAYLVIMAFLVFPTCAVASRRLGQHSIPVKGVSVLGNKFPPPPVFFHHFMQGSEPLLMKDVLNNTDYPAFKKWTDSYLKEYYGDELVYVELSKKERRGEERLPIRLGRFLDVYKRQDMYVVHKLPQGMHGEVMLPSTLRCGGFQRVLQDAVLWMSPGDTDSVLHQDDLHNINCLLDGKKELVLYDPAYKNMIEEVGWVKDGAYSELDPTDVDAVKYNAIFQAPWYQVNMRKGDCVYIPKRWYHYVHSPPARNLAVNVWFSHFWWFNQSDCDGVDSSNVPLSEFSFGSSNEPLRTELFAPFAGKKEVLQKKFVSDVQCQDQDTALKMFKRLNHNGDMKLTWEEMYSIDVDTLMHEFPSCFRQQSTGLSLGDSDGGPDMGEALGDKESDKDTGDALGDSNVHKNSGDGLGDENSDGNKNIKTDSDIGLGRNDDTVTTEPDNVNVPTETVETLDGPNIEAEDATNIPSNDQNAIKEDTLNGNFPVEETLQVEIDDVHLPLTQNDLDGGNTPENVDDVEDNRSDSKKHSKHTEL